MGRARKPTALKLVEGNRGHKALRADPEPQAGIPRCPPHVKGAARRLWNSTAAELDRLGLLAKIDATALEGFVSAYERALRADKAIARFGLTMDIPRADGSVYVAQRPEISISVSSWKQLKSFAGEFGLTPASRGRLSAPKPSGSVDQLEAMLG